MTSEAIRSSFVLFERTIKSLNSLLTTIAFAAALFFVVAQIPTLRMGMDTMISKLGQLQSFEALNLKVAFSETSVLEALPIFRTLDADTQATLKSDLAHLDAEWLPRLLNVGALDGTCDFHRTTPDIREAVATDQKLQTLGLVDLRDAEDVKARVLENMKSALDKGKGWEAGAPSQCYHMTLTGRGWRIKTAVLEFLASGLSAGKTTTVVASANPVALRLARGD